MITAKSAKAKGDKAEREVRALLNDHLGIDAPRLRAGATVDIGDLRLPECTVEVKNYADVLRALRTGVAECVSEQKAAGQPYGATFIRQRGGGFVVAMTPEQFCALYRAATS